MRCRKARWFLSARCDGTLSERQRVRLDEHLKQCSSCRQEAFYFSEIGALAGRLEQKTVRPDFDIRLRAAIRRAEANDAVVLPWYRTVFSARRRLVLVACTGVFAVVLAFGGYRMANTPDVNTMANNPQSVADPSGVVTGIRIAPDTQGDVGLSAGWTPVDGLSPDAQRIRDRYLAASRQPSDYVLETVRLNDPSAQKTEPQYLMPVVRSDQVVQKVSY